MEILLTGGAGYIGSHVALSLIDQGHNLTIIDNLSTGNKKILPKNINFINCNINDENKVSAILKNKTYDVLMHFAGFVVVEESVQNPKKYFKNNTNNAIKLFEICYKNNLKNIVFSSTAAVYGNPKNNLKITESENLKPINPYGESKLKTEKYLLDNRNKYNSIILRYFNVAGADINQRTGLISKNATHLIKILSEVAVGKREKIQIFGNDYNTPDGTAIRDYIHVSDLSDIHVEVAKFLNEKKISHIFNCGYGNGYSVKEVIDKANEITNGSIKYEFINRRSGDPEKLVSNVDKIHKFINWKPKYNNLSTIIKSSIDWEKKINEENL